MTTLLAIIALVAVAALGVVWLVLRHLRYCRDPDARGANAGLGRSSRSCGRTWTKPLPSPSRGAGSCALAAGTPT